jgi:ribosomal protein S18 acetylase RimI-like enzyme
MGQRLESSYGLSQKQLEEIKILEETCNRFEGLTMKLNWEMLTSRAKNEVNDFLLYENEELVGYLALYIFRDSEAEVSAMVHPKHRKKRIFRKLLSQARQELMVREIPSFLFICEEKSVSGRNTMKALKAVYSFSEYGMALQEVRPLPFSTEVSLKDTDEGDLDHLVNMDTVCFQLNKNDTSSLLQKQLVQPNRIHKIASVDGVKIGKISVLVSEMEAYIYGFCVLPTYQGKGYGKTILKKAVDDLIDKGHTKIALEVESKNKNALTLYERCGFEVEAGYDYYKLPVL